MKISGYRMLLIILGSCFIALGVGYFLMILGKPNNPRLTGEMIINGSWPWAFGLSLFAIGCVSKDKEDPQKNGKKTEKEEN